MVEQKDKNDILQKIAYASSTEVVNAIENMKLLHHTAYDYIVYKDYETGLKTTSKINFRT